MAYQNNMNWKQSLDRYLTTPPDDGFTDYCERVTEAFSDDFFNTNERWILDETEQIDKWFNKLFSKGIEPIISSKIIERAFKIYCL